MQRACCQAFKGALGHAISSGGYRKSSSIKTTLHPERKTPRPIFVAFLKWKTANEVISKSPYSLKNKPWRDEVTNSVMPIFVEQMFSPNVSKLRQQALKKRRELKDENPSWTVFLRYPAKQLCMDFCPVVVVKKT